MNIDRRRAEEAFAEYVENYDSTNTRVKLKIDHTYRVAELCEKIAQNLDLSNEDVDIAWLMGLLHDIGRFEQLKRYGTFNDAQSINHAKLGTTILFEENKIRDFIDDNNEDQLIKDAIDCHNAYRIPEYLSDRTKIFSNILRDADKIDIFKVHVLIPLEEIYNTSKEEIYTSSITKEVLDNFMEKDTVLRSLKKTQVDNVVGNISLIFGLVYKESIKIAAEQGDLYKFMEFKSQNDKVNKEFDQIREFVCSYIQERIK
ncbi:MAG TPA: metal-dependent phosphohydrolase [Clostridium sp.]|nr:metal-dependent phosphohydrolase [Clostridium sp.]